MGSFQFAVAMFTLTTSRMPAPCEEQGRTAQYENHLCCLSVDSFPLALLLFTVSGVSTDILWKSQLTPGTPKVRYILVSNDCVGLNKYTSRPSAKTCTPFTT